MPTAPFIELPAYDPKQIATGDAWALTVENSKSILIFGAGFYSFFSVRTPGSNADYVTDGPPVELRRQHLRRRG